MTDPYIGQDAAADNGRDGEGDDYPVTGNADIDALLRRIVTEGNVPEAAEIGRTLAYEVMNGPEDHDVWRMICDLTIYLTPDEITFLHEHGRALAPCGTRTLLSNAFIAFDPKSVRSAIVYGFNLRLARTQGPGDFERFFFVRELANQAAVCRLDNDGTLKAQTVAKFTESYRDKTFLVTKEDGEQKVGAAKFWLAMPETRPSQHQRQIKRVYQEVVFAPGREGELDVDDAVAFNMWRGWPVGCRPSDKMQPDDEDRCGLMLDHIRDNICGGDDHLNWWFLGFLRDMIVHPEQNRPIAVMMKGPEGSGKSMFCQLIGEWFGKAHFLEVTGVEALTGKFNKLLSARLMVFIDEPDGTDMRAEANELKSLISRDTITIERKGFDSYQERKFFRIFAASNDAHMIKAAANDRRYLVLTVDAGENNDYAPYFAALAKQWHNGGREAMFRWLRDSEELFAEWDWNKRPVTEGLQEQKDLSLDSVPRAVQQMLNDGTLPPMHRAEGGGSVFVATESFTEHYRLNSGGEAAANLKRAGELLGKLATSQPRRTFNDPKNGGARVQRRGYVLPPLAECRRLWEAHLGREVRWTNDDTDWALVPEQDDIPF